MAKHFGMKFELMHNLEPKCIGDLIKDVFCIEADTDFNVSIDALDKYYIHPESLHLLEPKGGDIIKRDCGGVVFKRQLAPIGILGVGEVIIERNGIAFMWPDIE